MPLPAPFKAYDIRGRLGSELTPDLSRRIGQVFCQVLGARTVVVGRDCRESSPQLSDALADGLMAAGADVLDIGLCGTEEVYFATDHLGADGGIMVTASHNPADYNGMKLVRQGARPVGGDTGLADIAALAMDGAAGMSSAVTRGTHHRVDPRRAYVDRVLSFVDAPSLAPLRILVNAGNGAAGPTFDAIAAGLAAQGAPVVFERLFHDPDGRFPNGIPNPLLPENQPATADVVRRTGADLGVAWDGDFDRCFLFDDQGTFVDGAYVVGLLAQAFLARSPGEKIVYDPRIVLNTRELVARAGGQAVMARTGHAYMKQIMRDEDAVYGGEMSAHHYFRDFMFCDSGMIPWLKVVELISQRGRTLRDLVRDRIARFPVSGETNFRIEDPQAAIDRVVSAYAPGARARDDTDGTSLEFADWRFNLRRSNTEPLVRLNVEARGDAAQVAARLREISDMLGS